MNASMAAVLLLLSVSAAAAELPEVTSPAEIAKAFPPRARLRVVNIWATWCVPCVAEMNDLRAIDEAFADRDVALVGVSLDDMIPGDKAKIVARVRTFLDRKAIRYRNLYYAGKPNALADYFRFDGEIPVTIVFDANGRELARHQGPIARQEFMKTLTRLLAKTSVRK